MKIKFADTWETIISSSEFPLGKATAILKNEAIAVVGYGIQGSAQAQNLRDNGLNVVVGQRFPSKSWKRALNDGWIKGKNLFPISDAVKQASIIVYLLSDSGQSEIWPKINNYFTEGKTLMFAHGFSIVFKNQTKVIPPKNIDVILVAPKGVGKNVRDNFVNGRGINCSYAIYQDYSGYARNKAIALAVAIGSKYMFETDFDKEVYSDLTSERGALLGAIAAVFETQYRQLRKSGHSPCESFSDTVEEATQNLYPLIGEKGMDYLISNCSTTAQIGALKWKKKFEKALKPVFQELYSKVRSGSETKEVLSVNKDKRRMKNVMKQLNELKNSEIWQTGTKVRDLRH